MGEQADGSRSRSRSQSDEPETYFNDLSRQPLAPSLSNEQQPKSKRMACVLCRKRKLKCDGARPACATCSRLSHDCAYDEVRKKSGPKRGYVKALEARLAQVETMLKTQDISPSEENNNAGSAKSAAHPGGLAQHNASYDGSDMDVNNVNPRMDFESSQNAYELPFDTAIPAIPGPGMTNLIHPVIKDFLDNTPSEPIQDPWGVLIGLDIEEPLPPHDVIFELNQLYFGDVHPSYPIIHRPRYLMAMANTSPRLRPPVALQYSIWASAAATSDKYESVAHVYYERARHYFERDEMRGQGEAIVTLSHVQALVLITGYEFKHLMFPRAWQSTGRAARLGLMLGLHKVDGALMDVKQCLPPPKDFVEREERRRTYWQCFTNDRYASIGTGWPMTLDEQDIMTNLPASEDAFERGVEESTTSLLNALKPGGASLLSPLAGVSLLSCLFGRNLLHLHRPSSNEQEENISGEFWKRHRLLDNIVLNTSLALPDQLRLPAGVNNPLVIFLNMCLHTSTICLHQAAIFKAEKHKGLAKILSESKVRCITAAGQVVSLMKLCSHIDMARFNSFSCFCIYVSARVFVQYLKSRPRDDEAKSSLYFMLSAMHAMKKKNALAESFLVQLDVDLEAADLPELRGLTSETPSYYAGQTRGGCPLEQVMPGLTTKVIPVGHTYGDWGIAQHSSPTTHRFGETDKHPGVPGHVPPGSTFSGIVPTRFVANSMPVRQRTGSSLGQSPQTLSPDMDTGGESSTASNSHSPNSLQNDYAGRVSSITSVSPPSGHQEDSSGSQTSYSVNNGNSYFHTRKQTSLPRNNGFNTLASTDQDMIFGENDAFSALGALDVGIAGGGDGVVGFDFSTTAASGHFDYSQYARDIGNFAQDQQQKSGLLPMTGVADLGSMTDAEFNAMMSGVAGWESG